MYNLLLSAAYLLLTFILTLLCYKYFGRIGLIVWICISFIMCTIQTMKISDFLGMAVSLGNILYGSIFLASDILNYKYGKEWAHKATILGFLAVIAFSFFMYLFLQFTPSPIDTSQPALEIIFNYVPRITIASLFAYYIGQTCNIYLFRFLNQKFHKLWISVNFSSATAQTIDTILFVTISFAGLLAPIELIQVIVTMLIVKLLITFCTTPFMYIASNIKKVREVA